MMSQADSFPIRLYFVLLITCNGQIDKKFKFVATIGRYCMRTIFSSITTTNTESHKVQKQQRLHRVHFELAKPTASRPRS